MSTPEQKTPCIGRPPGPRRYPVLQVRYDCMFNRPPKYTGPVMIGKAVSPLPLPVGPGWIGKAASVPIRIN